MMDAEYMNMTNRLGTLSIQRKLITSFGACLLFFIAAATWMNYWQVSSVVRQRVMQDELPASVAAIRNDLRRQITAPLSFAQSIAANQFLLSWEAAGLPQDGLAAWSAYAGALKARAGATSIFWVSPTQGRYLTDKGLERTVSRQSAPDAWLYQFLDSAKPYSLDLDIDKSSSVPSLFINVRYEAPGGRVGVAGIGLSVQAVSELIQGYRVGQTGRVFLVRTDGRILLHPEARWMDDRKALQDLPGMQQVAPRLLSAAGEGTRVMRVTHDGQARLVAVATVPELGLLTVAEVPEQEILAAAQRRILLVAVVTAVIAGALALGVIYAVSRAIAAPVRRAARLLGEIADGEGDLTLRLEVQSRDEIGQLAENFNRFIASLEAMVVQIRCNVGFIEAASREVAAGNHDLSSRTEQAASALQQTSASVSELRSAVQHNAEATRQTEQVTRQAAQTTRDGSASVRDVAASMSAMNASSRQIADIIATIDGIAFQTNILALNAAVEAARAGAQGRGFAVVATEVRTLAQRSAEAAREIRTLITRSVGEIQSGAAVAQTAGQSMDVLVGGIEQVDTLVRGIAASTAQQAQGLGEISQAIVQLDHHTQQNAALVEQSAAAASSLMEQSRQLSVAVSAFKVGVDPLSLQA